MQQVSPENIPSTALLRGLRGYLEDGKERIRTVAVFDYLDLPVHERTTGAARILSRCMKHLGWTPCKMRGLTSVRSDQRGYERPAQVTEGENVPLPVPKSWLPLLRSLQGEIGWDGVERVTYKQVITLLDVRPPRGYGRSLATVMRALGWEAVRMRQSVRPGRKVTETDQVRGYARPHKELPADNSAAELADLSQMIQTMENAL